MEKEKLQLHTMLLVSKILLSIELVTAALWKLLNKLRKGQKNLVMDLKLPRSFVAILIFLKA